MNHRPDDPRRPEATAQTARASETSPSEAMGHAIRIPVAVPLESAANGGIELIAGRRADRRLQRFCNPQRPRSAPLAYSYSPAASRASPRLPYHSMRTALLSRAVKT
jgi:hypothetical protein